MAVEPIATNQDSTNPARTTPIRGALARLLARSQGWVWAGLSADHEIMAATGIGEQIDQRGDAEMVAHLTSLERLAGLARRARQHDVYDGLVREIARTRLLVEWDDAEDYHRRRTGDLAAGAISPLTASAQMHETLLTGRQP